MMVGLAARSLVPLDSSERSTPTARSDSRAPHVNADADAGVIVDVNVDVNVDVDAPPVSRPWLKVPVSRTAKYFRLARSRRRPAARAAGGGR